LPVLLGTSRKSVIGLALDLQKDERTEGTVATTVIGAMKGFYNAGYRVPEDYSIIGFDDLEMASYVTPGLTTVKQQISLKGQKAVELLLSHLEDPKLSKQEVILPLQLVERGSVKTII